MTTPHWARLSVLVVVSSGGLWGQTVATPAFSPNAGTFNSAQTISISTTTSGASIRYTTDGSTPSETAGTLYSGSFTLSATAKISAIAYASGMTDSSVASATYTITSSTAQFVRADIGTHGSWKGVYGADGYNVINDTTAYPSYVTVTPSGQADYVWNGSTSDVRALQKASSSTDRLAATWYSGGSFSLDVAFNDVAMHQVAIYCVDWDNSGRTQTISILDAASNTVLDSRSLSSFQNGEYLIWNLGGHVVVQVTNTGSPNAVISGLFFDPSVPTSAPAVSPGAGTYAEAQTVSLTSRTSGASIRYTTDGSTPSETAGTLYSGPITVNTTTTIKALAYLTGWLDSSVTTATYTITASWYDLAWSNRKAITIAHAKVAGSSNLTGFPVLYSVTDPNLKSVANGGSVGLADGSDILFTAADGATKLAHEIESYDPTTGLLIAWVNVPALSPLGDTVIYVYYGNPGATNQQNPAAVWDSNYQAVWHLANSGSTLSVSDSTANANNGTATSVSAATGKIDGAGSSDGGHIDAANASSLQITGALTLEAWINANAVTGNYYRLISKFASGPYNGYELLLDTNTGRPYLQLSNNGALNVAYGSALTTGAWYHVVGTYDGASMETYVNGVANPLASAPGTLGNANSVLRLFDASWGSAPLNGILDEVRISSTARSASWIATEYNNESSPSTFYSIGSQESSGGPPQVATPTFSPAAGTYTSPQTVTISTTTSGASIRYTTDGSTPSETAGTLYTGPIAVSSSATLKAIAYASGMTDSVVSSAAYTIDGSGWYGSSWANRKPITVDHTKVAGSASLSSFPMLYSVIDPGLKSVANGGGVALADGSDILFTTTDGVTKLAHEIESYDPTTGLLIAWVNLPSLSPAVDTMIYVYYGNPMATSQQNPAAVWDGNYQGVWHLANSGGTLSVTDSTANANNGTATSVSTATGIIDGAGSSDGGHIDVANVSGLQITSALTLEAWVNASVVTGNYYRLISMLAANPANGYELLLDSNTGKPYVQLANNGDVNVAYGSALTTGTWYHVVGTYDGTNLVTYVNGVAGTPATASSTLGSPNSVLRLFDASWQSYPLDGMLDEVRVSSIARSASWIATEYNNASSPSTFYSTGSLQGPVTAAAPTFSPGAGTYTSPQSVTISTTTTGASIRYTTDGSTPSETAGTVYSGPITVGSTTTVKAIAYASGMADSTVATATYSISSTMPSISTLSPTFGSVATVVTITGANFGGSQGSSTVTFNGTNAGAASSWSASSITVAVPSGATTGNVVVTVGGSSTNGRLFIVGSSSFVGTSGSMGYARSHHTATRLTNGKVLIAGGFNASGVLGSSELYDPATQTFASTGPLVTQRWMHTATLLNDGTVLIAGGSSTGATLNTAEVYDPVAGTLSQLTNTLNTARAGQTATLLNNGQVLLVGGLDSSTGLIIQDAELYDPPTQTFIDLGPTTTPRFGHTATLLQNGQVLIAGGETDPTPSGAYDTAELYDPVQQVFNPVLVPMTATREGHAAVLLNNGQVLIAGGDTPGTGSLASAELYDPNSGLFTPVTAQMTAPRISSSITVLNGGKVLITGGATDSSGNSTVLNTAEIFDPASQTFTAAGNMTSAREYQSASLLNDGTILLTGGTDGTNTLSSAELYMPSQLTGLVSIAVTPGSPSIGVGGQQSFTATGTFGDGSMQTLASVLWSSSSPSVASMSGDSTNSGVAPAAERGTTTITASAGSISGSATLTVTAATLLAITVSPQDTVLPLGATLQFSANGNYSDGSTQDLTASVTWSSSTASVATINSAGFASGLLMGTASIQARLGSVNTSANISVGPAVLISIAISPITATVGLGATQQYQAIGTYSNGAVQDVTTLVSWSSSAASVASVGITGLAATAAQGTSTITASFEALSASSSLTVGPVALASISITPGAASISNGSSQQMTATGTYSDGSTQNITASSTWTSSNTAAATINSGGLATSVAAGDSVITATAGSVTGTALLTVTSPTTQGSLNTSRYEHNATVLNNGQILIAGGVNCASAGSCTYLSSAEIYAPGSDTFTTTGSMATARSAPAVLLGSGKVLVAGGYTCNSSGNCSSLNSVEIYDPAAATFSSAGTMTQARSGHTLTLLNDGTVLIAGGENCTSATSCTASSSAEIYDPIAATFTLTSNSMTAARFGASAALLNNGQVLIAGGFDGANLPAAAELYSPSNRTFKGMGPSLSTPRFNATATLLNNGKVLVVGGSTCNSPGCPTNAAEIYDPVANTFTTVSGGMAVARFDHTATLTTNGQVYVAGGFSSCGSTCTSEATTEVFDPVASTFSSGQSVTNALAGQTGTLTVNGSVLLIGGINAGVTLAGDQWYQPSTLTPSGLVSIAITPSSPLLVPGQTQQFVATGTFGDGSTQTLQSVVWTSSNPAVLAVSNSAGSAGLANALTAGTATLSATAGDAGGSATVNVAAPTSMTIAPANPSISLDATIQLAATGNFPDGSTHDVTAGAQWSSSSASVASVSNSLGSRGLTLGLAAGTTTISATIGSVSATTSVSVQAIPPAPSITSVSPTSGAAGVQVTVSGSGFGSAQGTGQLWLGTKPATVVSWGDTQIIATVATGSSSGNAQVLQNGTWSNTVAFNVATATISSVTPNNGVPGTQVTISGSGFGTQQGTGQVWLGTANAGVVSWSDTQVVAEIALGSTSGNAQILQNGVMSNRVPFTMNTLQISGISPTKGPVGTSVTITGTGFGSTQGSGTVMLGSVNCQITSWSNTQIVVTLPAASVSAAMRVQQGGQSNAVPFIVTNTGSAAAMLVPTVLQMLEGDTHTIQALSSTGQSVTGLTWTSSNTNVVSLSTDDPPVLTALAPGHVTITAGGATADVTVSVVTGPSGGLPTGTVLWSNPGDGSGVTQIIPAVPSTTGVADVFAIQNSGNVSAITSDGITAWTADVSSAVNNGEVIADFQGGLVLFDSTGNGSIMKLDGITGQAYPAYTGDAQYSLGQEGVVVHTDGTIFTTQHNSVIGIDPITGTQKFSVNLPDQAELFHGQFIIAGDGYAYLPYATRETTPGTANTQGYSTNHLMLARVSSSGASDYIHVMDWTSQIEDFITLGQVNTITNADTGVFLEWSNSTGGFDGPWQQHTAVTDGATATVGGGILPDQDVEPVLQAQDGSFVGRYVDNNTGQWDMIAFDAAGNVRWTVPNEQPQIATPDGFVAMSGTTYDLSGNVTGQLSSMPTQAWTGNAYQISPVAQIAFQPTPQATPPYASTTGQNKSANGTSPLCHDERDQLIAEYGKFGVRDSSYPKPYPRFTPTCFQLTNMAHSQYFSFVQINIPGPSSSPEFGYALVKNPLVVPASNGYGLDEWLLLYQQTYGVSRTINSGFRDPVQNQQGTKGAPTSRHMLGDAIDFKDVTHSSAELQNMNNTARKAGADFVETLESHTYCAATFRCGHADWRRHDRNKYALH